MLTTAPPAPTAIGTNGWVTTPFTAALPLCVQLCLVITHPPRLPHASAPPQNAYTPARWRLDRGGCVVKSLAALNRVLLHPRWCWLARRRWRKGCRPQPDHHRIFL